MPAMISWRADEEAVAPVHPSEIIDTLFRSLTIPSALMENHAPQPDPQCSPQQRWQGSHAQVRKRPSRISGALQQGILRPVFDVMMSIRLPQPDGHCWMATPAGITSGQASPMETLAQAYALSSGRCLCRTTLGDNRYAFSGAVAERCAGNGAGRYFALRI